MGTKIEWTEETWNPIIGCSKVSPGCDNCYAEKMAYRIFHIEINRPGKGRGFNYPRVVDGYGKWRGETHLVESALDKPFHWKKPRTIFVCSMGDLFHESVSHGWITSVLEVIQKCPQHTFQVLTKRPDIMKKYFDHLDQVMQHGVCNIDFLPLKNLWLGVTAENQEQADKRIPLLLEIPAAKRFVSIEPMLGPVDLTQINLRTEESVTHNVLTGIPYDWDYNEEFPENRINGLDWVICGGESGPGARPLHPDWVRSLRDQCQEARVPFFFKQWGEWVDEFHPKANITQKMDDRFVELIYEGKTVIDYRGVYMHRVGKKNAGHLLDGIEYRQKP